MSLGNRGAGRAGLPLDLIFIHEEATMPALTDAVLLDALKAVIDPNTGQDFVTAKQLKNLRIEGGDVAFDIELATPRRASFPACARP